MDTNQLKCPICGMQFNTPEEMSTHAKQMHEKKEEQSEEHAMVCTKCGFKVNSPEEMTAHETTSMNDAQHKMA